MIKYETAEQSLPPPRLASFGSRVEVKEEREGKRYPAIRQLISVKSQVQESNERENLEVKKEKGMMSRNETEGEKRKKKKKMSTLQPKKRAGKKGQEEPKKKIPQAFRSSLFPTLLLQSRILSFVRFVFFWFSEGERGKNGSGADICLALEDGDGDRTIMCDRNL